MAPELKTVVLFWAFNLFTPLLVSAAVLIPAPVPTAPIAPLNLTIISNSSVLNSEPICVIPPSSPFLVLDLHTCQPTFDRLLQGSDPDRKRTYYRSTRPIHLTNAPCAITLDRRKPDSNGIAMSAREIVGLAYRVVTFCEAVAVGGWTDVDGPGDWILTVTARVPGINQGNGVGPKLLADEAT
ncbi:hypothetical protein N7G274_009264 [Stereocaulon virgatum]|uniref:Uncharacterized protein n=1 Tax=Stereocaulon virgatum TaxID=373712 RepID=A0ABR3ZZS4_9LECA